MKLSEKYKNKIDLIDRPGRSVNYTESEFERYGEYCRWEGRLDCETSETIARKLESELQQMSKEDNL